MPVEIRKLVIKAVVDKRDAQAVESLSPALDNLPVQGQEALIQACVKQVLHILKREKQR